MFVGAKNLDETTRQRLEAKLERYNSKTARNRSIVPQENDSIVENFRFFSIKKRKSESNSPLPYRKKELSKETDRIKKRFISINVYNKRMSSFLPPRNNNFKNAKNAKTERKSKSTKIKIHKRRKSENVFQRDKRDKTDH